MYNISDEDINFAESIKQDRETLEANFTKTILKLETTLNIFSDTISLVKQYNLDKNSVFWNIARYINIISLDLKILSKHQAFAETEWEKRLFARQISLLIYEAIDDILFLLGKEFKIIANDYKDDNSFSELLNEIRSKLNLFKTNHYERIKAHRNTSIAHRDKDTSEQLKHIYSISWLESVNMSGEFDRILNYLGMFLEIIMRGGISDGPIKFNAY
jgi:hypothetical protein